MALKLVELPGDKIAALAGNGFVNLVDQGRLADAGVAGN